MSDVQLNGSESGVELANWIRSNYSKTGLVLVSGGVIDDVPKSCEFLSKPFPTSELIEKLGLVLQSKQQDNKK